jgi:fibronectin-binding autotransporter adhesin
MLSAATLLSALAVQATTYTATNNASWNTASTWDPNGIPGASDVAIIPIGKTVTYGGTPATVGAIQVAGTFSISSAGTLGDVSIESTGTFNPTTSGAAVTFSGNVTNQGNMSIASLGSGTIYTYTGAGKTLAGNISNVVAVINGTYQNVGTFVTGLKGTQDALKGSGALANLGTLVLASGQNTTPSIATLDCSAVPNLVTWTGFNGTATPKATAYYDLVLGSTGSAGWNLNGAGLSIAHNLTILNNAPINSWPVNGTIPGAFTYSASSSTASTFPAAFTVGAFNMSNGRITLPAAGTLTVTNTGVGVWTRSGGNFTPNATGTVRFTGAAPDINGGFTSLLVDSTATGAISSTSLFVTNSLTIAAGASLDVTALSGGSHIMLSTESYFGSGTLKGTVTTVSGSKVYAGTDGGFGTSHITGNLTMAAGSTNAMDIDVTAAAPHDLLVVDGALTLNNTRFRLKAPSAGIGIDTANDYLLTTAASISGTPVLQWVTAPADSTNYTLITDATTIRLHYAGGSSSGSPVLSRSFSGGNLTLSWDTTAFPGYFVVGQTNSAGLDTNNASWTDSGSGGVSPFVVPINPANPAVFFRLRKP